MKFVDIKNDIAFRKIFGNENRKEVLISFLNAVLMLDNGHQITDVEILSPYQLPELAGGKVTIVDLKAKDQSDKQYIIEMQVAEIEGFDKRVLYYASKSYSSQIDRGELYNKLNPTFFIGILEFNITQNSDYLSRHKITDLQTGENLLKDIEFNFIELPKFNKTEPELNSIIDQWVYFIKNAENLDVIPESVQDEGLIKAYRDADKHNWTKEELEAYDYVFMREQDYRGRISFDKRKAEEEKKKAAEESKIREKKAAEEGKLEGERLGKLAIAEQMLADKMPLEVVAKYSGFSIEELNEFIEGK
jgi:predicted transposase/invertase (TIGR01784 family)